MNSYHSLFCELLISSLIKILSTISESVSRKYLLIYCPDHYWSTTLLLNCLSKSRLIIFTSNVGTFEYLQLKHVSVHYRQKVFTLQVGAIFEENICIIFHQYHAIIVFLIPLRHLWSLLSIVSWECVKIRVKQVMNQKQLVNVY